MPSTQMPGSIQPRRVNDVVPHPEYISMQTAPVAPIAGSTLVTLPAQDLESTEGPEPIQDSTAYPGNRRPSILHIFSQPRVPVLLGGFTAALIVACLGAWGVLSLSSHHSSKQFPASSSVTVPNFKPDLSLKGQTLSLNGNLQVRDNTTIKGDLTVDGTTTLQGVVVKAAANFASNIFVQGNGSFSGSISAANFTSSALSVTGNSNFSGNITVNNVSVSGNINAAGNVDVKGLLSAANFQGIFNGDGSKITNLSAVSCKDCVRLQGANPVAQSGNVSVNGAVGVTGSVSVSADVTVAGRITGSKLHIAAGSVTDALNVQDAIGADVLSIDTQHHRIAVNTLVPTTAGTLQPGSLSRGTISTVITANMQNIANDNDHWSVLGPDGFVRFGYYDGSSSTEHFVRCKDVNCSLKTDSVLEQDANNGLGSPVISLDAQGNAYLLYIVYSNPYVYHLAHCGDQDCTQSTIQTVATAALYGYNVGLSVDTQGLPRFVFDVYNYLVTRRTYGLEYVQCLNADCSSKTQTEIAGGDATTASFYEISTIAAGRDGLSRIAYIDAFSSKLVFVRCLSADCVQRTSTQVDEGNYYVSLAIGSDGLAKMTSQGAINRSQIRYTACKNADCTVTSKALIATNFQSGYSSLALDANNVPHISFYAGNDPTYTAPVQMYLAACADVNCSLNTAVQLTDIGKSGYTSSLHILTDGTMSIVYSKGDYGAVTVNLMHVLTPDGQDTRVKAVQSDGTTIGTPTSRFGTFYGQQIDLQSASAGSALIVNQVGINATDTYGNLISEGTGSLAQFQVNGQTRVEIDKKGSLLVSGDGTKNTTTTQIGGDSNAISIKLAGTQKFAVDNLGNVRLQDTNLIAASTAPINPASYARITALASVGSTTDLLQARDSSGSTVFNVGSTGNLVAGKSGNCAGCLPGYVTGLISTPSAPKVVKVVGDYAYVSSTETPTLSIYNVKDPDKPRQVASIGTQSAGGFVIDGNYLYVAMTRPNNGIQIYDISSPQQPKLISAFATNTGGVNDVVKQGNYVYALADDGLRIVDVTNPAAPLNKGLLTLSANGYGNTALTIVGSHVYFVNTYGSYGSFTNSGTLFAVDVSDPLVPTITSSINSENADYLTEFGDNVVAKGNYLYYSNTDDNTNNEVKAVDISDPANMRIVARAHVTAPNDLNHYVPGLGQNSHYSQINGDSLYVSSPEGFDVFDITNPASLVSKGSVTTGTYLFGFAVVNNRIYSVDLKEQLLRIYGFGSAKFNSGISAAALNVTGATTVGNIIVGGDATIKQSSLVVTGISAPTVTYAYAYTYFRSGTLSGAPGTKYYYRITSVANGHESAPTDETVFDMDNAYLYDPNLNYFSVIQPTVNGPGLLTGTYKYKYTNVSKYGESTLNGNDTTPITTNSESVSIAIINAGTNGVIRRNVYRCDATACSYKLVGAINDNTTTTFVDNNPTYGVDAPTINTARADTNSIILNFTPINGVKEYYIYRSLAPGGPYTKFSTLAPSTYSFDGTNGFYIDTGSTPGVIAAPPIVSEVGRVGIGTDAPKANLHVAGTALFQNTSQDPIGLKVMDGAGGEVLSVNTAAHTLDLPGGSINAQGIVLGGQVSGLNQKWYNSDSTTYKTVGSGVLATSFVDAPINYTNLVSSRPSGVNQDYINADFSGHIKADYTETYTFYTASDDGSRIYINGQQIVNNWFDQGVTERSGTISLVAGQTYAIDVQFYKGVGGAAVTASWSSPSTPKALIPKDHLFSTASSGVTIKASSGQTAPVLQAQDTAGNVLTSIGPDGSISTISTNSVAILARAGTVATTPIVARGFSGQTADLFQATDSAGNVVFNVDASGNIAVGPSGSTLAVQKDSANYIVDPTFFAGVPVGRGSGTRQAVTGKLGTATGRAIKITPNNDWTTIGAGCPLSGAPGTYTMSFIAWTDIGTAPVQALDGPGTGVGTITATSTPKRYDLTWTHGNTCNSFEIGPSGGTNPVYIADWQVEAGSTGSNFIYGDGGSGFAWSGAANSSVSTRAAGLYVGSGLFAQGALVVKSATFNGTLSVNGHIITGNTSGTTSAAVGAGAGTGASCSVSGNDTAGTVTVTSGSSAAATGTVCTISFASSFAAAPKVVMTARTASGALLPIYQTSSTSNFVISAASAPATSTTYSYDYTAVQ